MKIFYTLGHDSDKLSCNFHDPCGRGYCAELWPYKFIVKINYFYESLLRYSQAQIRQIEGIVMVSR